MGVQARAVVRAEHSARMAGCEELATKSDVAAHIAGLIMRFTALETKFAEFRAEVSAAVNRVIFVQVVLAAALFAALKLS